MLKHGSLMLGEGGAVQIDRCDVDLNEFTILGAVKFDLCDISDVYDISLRDGLMMAPSFYRCTINSISGLDGKTTTFNIMHCIMNSSTMPNVVLLQGTFASNFNAVTNIAWTV